MTFKLNDGCEIRMDSLKTLLHLLSDSINEKQKEHLRLLVAKSSFFFVPMEVRSNPEDDGFTHTFTINDRETKLSLSLILEPDGKIRIDSTHYIAKEATRSLNSAVTMFAISR